MRAYVSAFMIASLAAAILTPLVRVMALRVGALSHPGGRHIHRAKVPRLGGIAIFVAWMLPLLGMLFVDSSVAKIFWNDVTKALGLFLGGLALCVVGVVDDTRGLSAKTKLFAQIVVACAAFACGLRVDLIALPMVGVLPMGIFALPVTVLWIVGIVNAVNLIDGLDGLAAGIVLFACSTNFVVALIGNTIFIAVVMAALIGALFGFLFFNFNPARIFMGDSGSYFLGYSLATSVLVGASQKAPTAIGLLVPCLALGVPIFDTLFSMVRRFLERRPIFSPDRGHIHHRLLDMGLTHRRAVLTIYGVSVVFSISAIAVSLGKSWQVGLALIAASIVFLGLVRFAGYFEYLQGSLRQRARLRSPQAEALRAALPHLLETLGRTESPHELAALLVREGPFCRVELLGLGENMAEGSDKSEADTASGRYPLSLPHVSGEVVFTLSCDSPRLPADTEILLQVVADGVTRALGGADPPAPAVASAPVPLAAPALTSSIGKAK